MKLSSVRHLTYEGFKNVWDNRLMSLASVGVLICCMSLIGAAMLLTFNIDKAMMALEKENVINPDDFLSKGKATPFEDMKVKGECVLTVCNGKVAYTK